MSGGGVKSASLAAACLPGGGAVLDCLGVALTAVSVFAGAGFEGVGGSAALLAGAFSVGGVEGGGAVAAVGAEATCGGAAGSGALACLPEFQGCQRATAAPAASTPAIPMSAAFEPFLAAGG